MPDNRYARQRPFRPVPQILLAAFDRDSVLLDSAFRVSLTDDSVAIGRVKIPP